MGGLREPTHVQQFEGAVRSTGIRSQRPWRWGSSAVPAYLANPNKGGNDPGTLQ